jgi:hypothetical protein
MFFKPSVKVLPPGEQIIARKAVSWARERYTVKEISQHIKVSPVTINRWYYWGVIPGKENWPALKSFYEKEVECEVRQSHRAVQG